MDKKTEFIIEQIKNKYKSVRQFALEIGVPYTTIKSGLKSGVGGMAVGTVIKMCQALGINVEDLEDKEYRCDNLNIDLKNSIPVGNLRRIPIIGAVKGGFEGLAIEDHLGFEYADVKCPEEHVFFQVKGDSMEPKISDGDLALVRKQPDIESGQLAVVVIDGEYGMIKKVIKKENTIALQSFNPNYPPRIITGDELKEVYIFGKVISTITKW